MGGPGEPRCLLAVPPRFYRSSGPLPHGLPCVPCQAISRASSSVPDGLSHALAFPQADIFTAETDTAGSSPWPLLMGALMGCLGVSVVALSWIGCMASKTGPDKVQKRSKKIEDMGVVKRAHLGNGPACRLDGVQREDVPVNEPQKRL